MKKKWEKPKLIVLVRAKPDELVLSGCRSASLSGATTSKSLCRGVRAGQCNQANCSAFTAT